MPPIQTNIEPIIAPIIVPTAPVVVPAKKLPRQRHFLITFFFSFM